MNTSILIKILNECAMSPEELAEKIGISGMTVRRWIQRETPEELSELYQTAIQNAALKLIVEGRLADDSALVLQLFSHSEGLVQKATIKALGFPDDLQGNFESHQDQITMGLVHIGSQETRRQRVNTQKKKILSFKKLGKEWSERISLLTKVISSDRLSMLDKCMAYGALFYLLMVFDLIPDTVPVFGLLDDFAILGIAAAYYAKRSKILSS
jgi:uncharacterized membrane protein YkvA (DUF1232 family)